MGTIRAETELRELIGMPSEVVVSKIVDHLNPLTRRFIEVSPFLCIATSAPDGRCDVSPRGDPAGFVRILDDRTLLIPDRPGNRIADTLRNILANPHVGLVFLIPGVGDSFRVNGRASVIDDPELLAASAIDGRAPRLGILIEIEEAYTQCSKALIRSDLWNPSTTSTAASCRRAVRSCARCATTTSMPSATTPSGPSATRAATGCTSGDGDQSGANRLHRVEAAAVSGLPITTVGEDERGAAVATITAAFVDDPVERWLYPQLDAYTAHFPAFVAAFGAGAFEGRTVWKLGNFSAVALWLGPGVAADGSAIVDVLAGTVPAGQARAPVLGSRPDGSGSPDVSPLVPAVVRRSPRTAGRRVLAEGCWSTACGLWTRAAFPPTSRPPIRARSRSMSVMDSGPFLSRLPGLAHR